MKISVRPSPDSCPPPRRFDREEVPMIEFEVVARNWVTISDAVIPDVLWEMACRELRKSLETCGVEGDIVRLIYEISREVKRENGG
jgi:hypothetical protein